SIQQVPISIAAFTDETLEKMGVTDVKALAGKVPNVYIKEFPSGGGTTIQLYIRGVGQNDVQVTQDPSVALYMDGVYIGSSLGTAFESADIQRIEVLRGPQGTLYGRNATGGAINLITNKADPSGFYFQERLTGGNLDAFRTRTIANLPISDTVAAKLAYSYSERDGWVENEGNGEDFGSQERDNVTADFHWDASDSMTVDYKYERPTIQDTSRLSQIVVYNKNAPTAGLLVFENPAKDPSGNPVEATDERLDKATSFDEQLKGDQKIDAHTLDYAWEINDELGFRSITGYRDLNSFYQTSQSPTTSLNLGGKVSVTNALANTDFEQFSQEFQLLGSTDTLNWVAGLYYYEDQAEENNNGDTFGSEAVPDNLIVDFTSTDNTALAVFGQATWTPEQLELWHFTLGARYSDDSRKAKRENSRVSYGFGGAPSGVPSFEAEYDQNFDEFNPAFTVQYDLTDFSNVYAKVVTAYKAGGTSQRSQIEEAFEEGFEPENLTSYELGYKSDLLDGRMRINGAVFLMEFEDYQQSVQTSTNPAGRDFVNIDDAEIAGLELDFSVAITDQLTGTLSYGYLDTSFGPSMINYRREDASAAAGYVIIEETLTESLAQAPDNSATASLDYSLPLSFATLNANVNAQYEDDTNSGVVIPTGVQDDRVLVNASIGLWDIDLGTDTGTLRVSLWGNNLFDEEYYLSNVRLEAFELLGVSEIATFGDPRTYGVTFEYNFD
ncbi:MAG TPA: TonB-dependent receptor, partial [Halioglobus sp.]